MGKKESYKQNNWSELFVILTMVIVLFLPEKLFSQEKYPSLSVHQDDLKIVFHYIDSRITPVDDVMYYWMKYRVIHNTEGGYSGQLLHGDYKEYFISGQLKTTGTFKKGAKVGQWKHWYENGKTSKIIGWRNGIKNGSYTIFFENGRTKEKGRFKSNYKEGVVIEFDKLGNQTKLRFKRGERVDRAAKKESRAMKRKEKQEQKELKKATKSPKIQIINQQSGQTKKVKKKREKKSEKKGKENKSDGVSSWDKLKVWLGNKFNSKESNNEKD